MSEFNPRKTADRRFEPHTCVLRLVREKIPDAARVNTAATQGTASSRQHKRGSLGKLHARLVSSARSAIGRAEKDAPAVSPVRARPDFLGPDRYLIQFTTNRAVYEKLALASVLLGERKNPASLEDVVTIALEVLFDGVA